ncbi:MAG: lysylphosphatidylglycerol synthase transmembrane domain-containing protein [Dongiaceae bacterium]
MSTRQPPASAPMPRWLLPLLQAGVSLGLLGVLIIAVDWDELRRAAGSLSSGALALAIAVCLAAQSVLVLRWRALLDLLGVNEYWARSWHSVFGGLFLTNFLPGTLGSDGLRIVLLTKSCGRASTAIGAVAYERLVQLALYVMVAVGAALFPIAGPPIWLRLGIVLCGIMGIVAGIVVLYWLGSRTLEPAEKPVGVVRAALSLAARILVEIGRMQTKMRRHRLATWVFWLASALNVAALIAVVEILLVARGTNPGITAVALAASAATVATALPLSINGIGIYEVTLTWLLSTTGVPTAEAFLLALTLRLIVMAVSLVGWPSVFVLRAGSRAAQGGPAQS